MIFYDDLLNQTFRSYSSVAIGCMMNCLPILAVYLLASINLLQGRQFERRYINPITGSSNPGECPGESVREDLRSTIHQKVRTYLQNLTQNATQGQESTGIQHNNIDLCQICMVIAQHVLTIIMH